MTLRRKMVLGTILLIVGLTILIVNPLVGLTQLRQHVRRAHEEYQELRIIQSVTVHLAAAKGLLGASTPDPVAAAGEMGEARRYLDEFDAFQHHQQDPDPDEQRVEDEAVTRTRQQIAALATWHSASQASTMPTDFKAQMAALDGMLADLNLLADAMDHVVEHSQRAVGTHLQRTFVLMVCLSVAILLGAIVLNVAQYRGIMQPLDRLRRAARQIASGHLDARIEGLSLPEFADVAGEFNRMAEELAGLYRNMEDKIQAASRDLARSERLASVGFLAAGVAHELNSPLNIISGHAELSLRGAARASEDTSPGTERLKSLEIIRDESFRCKRIIEKLLSLTPSGDNRRERVDLAALAREVVEMVQGLKQYRDKSIEVRIGPQEALSIQANAPEMKQVILNLVVNAMEAIDPGSGKVVITGATRDNWVELSVQDNGRGMAGETRDRVFEPFFSSRGSGGRAGVGLGLSITHAIVEAHAGRIAAQSDGVGRGSCFTLRFPTLLAQEVARA